MGRRYGLIKRIEEDIHIYFSSDNHNQYEHKICKSMIYAEDYLLKWMSMYAYKGDTIIILYEDKRPLISRINKKLIKDKYLKIRFERLMNSWHLNIVKSFQEGINDKKTEDSSYYA